MAGWPPKKGVAFPIFITIRDNDGDPISDPAGLSVAVSKDFGAETGIFNAPEKVSPGSAIVGFTLDAGDMNVDVLAGLVSSTSSNAKDAFFSFYTDGQQIGDLFPTSSAPTNVGDMSIEAGTGRVDVGSVAGLPLTVGTTNNRPQVDVYALDDDRAAAQSISKSASTIIRGAAVAGTLSTTQMTTNLSSAVDDFYNGRIIIWTSGALQNQASDISDYAGSNKLVTFTNVTSAPSADDTFVVV